MSFGSSMRFEVKDKGGIFWQKEKPKNKPRKFGYKNKELRHAIRKPEVEYIEEAREKPKPDKDFIRRNREQYKKQDNKENLHTSGSSSRPGSGIKPGTVTLTQDQLNALLATVGKLKPGEAGNLRISIDAENNRLQLDSPRDNLDSAPAPGRSDGGGNKTSVQGEASIFDLAKDKNNSGQHDNRDSSGYGSEEKSVKEIQFDTTRNERRENLPEAPSTVPPPMVPWRHMTVGERKRLQWAREKAAEEEINKQKGSQGDPWGRPGAGAPARKAEPEPQESTPAKATEKTPQNRPKEDVSVKAKEQALVRAKAEEEKLRKAIDDIETKYRDLLYPPTQGTASSPQDATSDSKAESNKVSVIPGLDSSYAIPVSSTDDSQKVKQLEDKGNARPPKGPDRRRERNDRAERQPGRQKKERDGEKAGGKRREERGRRPEGTPQAREEAVPVSEEPAMSMPAAGQTSLFIGQSEPDNTQFRSKKEEEKKRWLEELDRQREEKRLQKQKEREWQRQGVDDTWADRFATQSLRQPSRAQQYQAPSPAAPQAAAQQPTYAATAVYSDRSGAYPRTGEQEQLLLPPAAMRSAMAIGDAAPNLDKIELRQAEEKRLWLEELNKQREEQRIARMQLKEKQRAGEDTWADRFAPAPVPAPHAHPAAAPALSPRNPPPPTHHAPWPADVLDNTATRTNSAPQPAVNESLDDANTTHLRGQNVHMDPVTRRELEDKRRKHLEYQAAIKAQIEEKERQKRDERERKWREEAEEERKLKAERDSLQKQLEQEDSKNRQKEEARQRQVEHLKVMMDAETERAQEERMLKRLNTLKQAGHDVTGLKAHYEDPGPNIMRISASRQMSTRSGARALTPRLQQATRDPSFVPGLVASPRDSYGAHPSSRTNAPGPGPGPGPTYTAADIAALLRNSQDMVSAQTSQPPSHEPYMENRVLTPSRFRQPSKPYSFPSSPLREFATQTGKEATRTDDQELAAGLRKEVSDVEIEFRDRGSNKAGRQQRNGRGKSADSKKPAEAVRGRPPAPKQNKGKQEKGKPATWNYQNPKRKAPVKQSEKDPFYEQKRQESEERRARRERQLQYLVELNQPAIPTGKPHAHPSPRDPDPEGADRGGAPHGYGHTSTRSRSPPVNRNGKYRPSRRQASPPVPAVRHRDFDGQGDGDWDGEGGRSTFRSQRLGPGFTPDVDEGGAVQAPVKDTDFIPFTRTTDILDPSRADEPVQLSRENTRIRQARQHYYENLRPADFGNQLDTFDDGRRQPAPKNKDPILNPGLVKDYPTARQDQILQQLSSLKQSLIQRQREIETCMSPSDLEKQM